MEPQPPDVSVADALRFALGVLRRRTGTVLPYYALVAATVDVARLPLVLGVLLALFALSTSGDLQPLLDDFAGLNPELLGPGGAGPPPGLSERLVAAVFSPTVVVLLLVAGVGGVVAYVLARGVARAAALAALAAVVDDRDPLAAGIDGTSQWRTFAGLVVARWGLLVAAAVPLVAAAVGSAATVGAAPDPTALGQEAFVAVLVALAGVLVTVVAALIVLGLLAFAGPVAVVDDVGLPTAVRRSAGIPFAHPVGFLLYALVVVSGYVGIGVLGVLFGIAGVGRLVPLGSAFVLAPLFDGVAVALYADWTGERPPSAGRSPAGGDEDGEGPSPDWVERSETVDRAAEGDESGFVFGVETAERDDAVTRRGRDEARENERETGERGLVSDVGAALRGGLFELGGFLRHDWQYVAAAALTLAVGVSVGWTATAGSGVRIETPSDPASVFGAVPVGPFIDIAANNWFVATSAGFSGVFAGLPTVGTLLFNGLLVGAVAGVVDPVAFVALVAPHGVIELPAIAVAGGVGLRLGHVSWRYWRGTRPASTLVDELGRTWRLVVGLAVVFVVAGFVEAFVTPPVAAWVLG